MKNRFELNALDPLKEAVLRIDGITITDMNKSAADLGFKTASEIFPFISFDRIDELTKAIIAGEYFECESNLYFLTKDAQYSKIIYDSRDKLLFILDLSEKELLKKVKADVVTAISHELRTPLSVAMGNVQMLKDFSSDSKNEKIVNKIQDSLEKLEKIISQLSLLTQAEFGNYTRKYEVFDTQALYNDVISDLSKKIEEKNVTINLFTQKTELYADRFIIYTILRNLISNAVKYSNKNAEINVKLSPEIIEVEDFGIGIREEEKQRVFERFFRGTDALKLAQGSGLGLPIVKYLCELCDYKLGFTTRWMIGSKFTVKLK